MEFEYVATCEVIKEGVWHHKFLVDFEVVPNMNQPLTLYFDNSGVVANLKKLRIHRWGKNIKHNYHLIQEIVH